MSCYCELAEVSVSLQTSEISGDNNKCGVFATTKGNVSTFRKIALTQESNIFQITNA